MLCCGSVWASFGGDGDDGGDDDVEFGGCECLTWRPLIALWGLSVEACGATPLELSPSRPCRLAPKLARDRDAPVDSPHADGCL